MSIARSQRRLFALFVVQLLPELKPIIDNNNLTMFVLHIISLHISFAHKSPYLLQYAKFIILIKAFLCIPLHFI